MADILEMMVDHALSTLRENDPDRVATATQNGHELELHIPIRVKFMAPVPGGLREGICCICTSGPGGMGPPYCRGDCC